MEGEEGKKVKHVEVLQILIARRVARLEKKKRDIRPAAL